jgi:hypothetical protein
MRLGDLFCFVPAPLGSVVLFLQHQWLAAILVAGSLTLFGVAIRFVNAHLKDVDRAGGRAAWKLESYATVDDREKARTLELRANEDRRMIKLEGEHQRREFKHRNSNRADQLRLFRW